MSEYDYEPIRGLPGALPEREAILWQGAPSWRVLASEAFHIRAVAAYFAAMLAWRVASGVVAGQAPGPVVAAAASTLPLALLALGILAFLAWLNSRTTVYTITNRRVVLRFGAAIPKAINVPFTIVEAAAVKTLVGGAGDLALTLKAPNKMAFLQLWPHCRPWRMTTPQPTMRAVDGVADAASILASAIQRVAPIERIQPAAAPGREAAIGFARPEPVAA